MVPQEREEYEYSQKGEGGGQHNRQTWDEHKGKDTGGIVAIECIQLCALARRAHSAFGRG